MLAHEVALLVRPAHLAANPKTNKHRPVNEPKRLLPNGDVPVFHTKEKSRKAKPSLPNGERPNFGPDDLKKEPNKGKLNGKQKKGKKSNNSPASKNANESKKSITNNTNSGANHASKENKQAFPAKDSGKKSGEESYAGSSFHSSPEALALPKPSFKSSPKQPTPVLGQQSPIQPVSQQHANNNSTNMGINHMNVNLNPAFVYQGIPAVPPPRYPVTSYPAGPYHIGYDYRSAPQTFFNYPYLPAGIPQGHVQPQQFVPPQQVLSANQQFAPSGQRISFNDLMNSSK